MALSAIVSAVTGAAAAGAATGAGAAAAESGSASPMAEAAPPTMSGTAVGEEANCSMMLPHGTPGLVAGSAPASGVQI
jgi:hypothetical protein